MFGCHLTSLTLLYTLLTIDDQLCDFVWVVFYFGKEITGYYYSKKHKIDVVAVSEAF